MKKIKFDADQAKKVQEALESIKNETLKAMAADMIQGGVNVNPWAKSTFSKD
ncbi:hypothetical protein HGH92_30410 [Chitinophaga varians]|uniref:Uncharacterized protein n=1 Tax=Chitinophaga varians TaxID=2202339 RepID=A0A847S5E5_9BACT|nr:hypothetical protein [Chitinophaga varians]NLR68655.1 hypothetical protein [Chitinophaga varians]